MPEINPYEAPQSEELPRADQQSVESLPPWLGRALWLQLAAIAAVMLLPIFTRRPQDQLLLLLLQCLLGITALLSLMNLIYAIRYRIGWLVILELIVFGLPLMFVLMVGFPR